MLWQIASFPPCKYHVFLSHCREDRRALALPLKRALEAVGIVAWLDQHNYPYGRPSFAALRDGVLQCRHTVFLVTPHLLAQPRGWANIELAWAQILEENLLSLGGALQYVMLPLLFARLSHRQLQRSVWQTVRDRAAVHKRGDPVTWACKQIRKFLEHEAAHGLDIADLLEQDSRLRAWLEGRPGLIDRITARHPTPAPPP